MKKIVLAFICLLQAVVIFAQTKTTVYSPNSNVQLNFWLTESGAPQYEVLYKRRTVLLPSGLGFELKQTMNNTALPTLRDHLSVTGSTQKNVDNKWTPVWGDMKVIKDNYNQLTVNLSQKVADAIVFNIVFKVFDDGVGFRYEFPPQKNLQHFIVS